MPVINLDSEESRNTMELAMSIGSAKPKYCLLIAEYQQTVYKYQFSLLMELLNL